MEDKNILVLGGYGGTGRVLCKWLLRETDVSIVLAARNLNKADQLTNQLNQEFPGNRATAVFADASDYQSLVKAFKNIKIVIDATIAIPHVQKIAEAAIEAKVDYLDFHFEQNVVSVLKALEAKIIDSNRCFITQAGFHPGLPSTFIRYASPQFDVYERAIVGMSMSAEVEKPESLYELVDLLGNYRVDIFKNGKWKNAGNSDFKRIDFGPRFGVRICYPIQMEELREMPEMFGLNETGVYVAGFNWFVDNLVFPLAFLLFKIKKGLGRAVIARLLAWGMNAFSGSKKGVSFVLEAEGKRGGKPVKIRVVAEHDNAYEFTAIPIVACIRQYLDGGIAKPGLWMMGHIVDTDRLFEDMARMGIEINTLVI